MALCRPPREHLARERMALDLARRRERKLLEELDLLRQLVSGHAAAEEAHDLVQRRRLGARARDHAQAVALAEARVGDAHDGGVQDARMRVEDLLDLAGEELLAATVDHLLETPHDA